MDTPSGMTGRRARWHEKLSRFQLTVVYIAGTDNEVADAMSRWAYPASQGYGDISIHGNEEDDEAMEAIIAQEKMEERACSIIQVHNLREALTKALQTKTMAQVEYEIAQCKRNVNVVEINVLGKPKTPLAQQPQQQPGPVKFTFKRPTGNKPPPDKIAPKPDLKGTR